MTMCTMETFGGVEEGTPPLKMSVDDIIATTSTREAWLEVVQPICGDLSIISSIKNSTFYSGLNIGK